MKKILVMLLALAMLCGILAGCGGGTETAGIKEEDVNVCPEDTYEINWYINADPQKDIHDVEAKINEYLKDKINATVKLNCISSAQYSQKLGTMINAGEYFDLCFVARWMLDYVNNSRVGAFVNLNDYLDTYLKDIADDYGREYLKFSEVDGGLYALPVYKERVWQYGWIYRKDIADKYGIDMSQYKSFEELEPVLQKIKENEPDIRYPLDYTTDVTPAALWQMQNCVNDTYLFYDGTEHAGKSTNIYEQEEWLEACRLANDFYEKEYVRPDILTATDHLQRMEEGKTFVMLQSLKPGKVNELFGDSKYEFAQTEIMEPRLDYLAGTGSMQAVSSSSKNPARVMRFLNLLNTDPYLNNLVKHGIEGKHYEKVGENTVKQVSGSEYSLYKNTWAISNVFNDYILDTEPADKNEALNEFNDRAKTSELDNKILTFIPAADSERERIQSEVNKVISKYVKQMRLGVIDPDSVIDEFRQQLLNVGMDELRAEYQKQFDEFCKK